MIFLNQEINSIVLPKEERDVLIGHCLRKMNAIYMEDEEKERKAYGLIGGKIIGNTLYIGHIAPLHKNSRSAGDDKRYMDSILNEHAEASETPLARRGWVADPIETISTIIEMGNKGLELVGAYHMHRVAWEDDPTRELPTYLDTVLAKDSGIFTFIISTVNPEKPVIRAFYEGYPDQEVKINNQ